MKITCRSFLTVLGFILSLPLFAQQPQRPIHFLKGNFIAGNKVGLQLFNKQTIVAARFNNQYFVVLQFDALPTIAVQQNLKNAGIRLHDYLPGNAYFASVDTAFNFKTARQFGIAAVNALPPFYKIDAALLTDTINLTKQNDKKIVVSFYPSVDKEIVIQQLQQLGATIVATKFDGGNIIFIQADKTLISAIAALPFVNDIRLQSIKDKELNYNQVAAHGVGALSTFNGRNLRGKDVTLGIGDNANISSHSDFSGRAIIRTALPSANHGTHTAGTMAGAGIVNVKYRGMAPAATIINQAYSDIISNAPVYITDNKMVITNNSYHSVDDLCPGDGVYDVLSNYVDKQTGRYPSLLHVFAAGNDGGNTCTPYPVNFGTVKSGWQSAKNVLTVGALNTDDYTIAYFSSRGPVNDGRIKPEITAGGWNVISTFPNNNYGSGYGTSMASPAVAGAMALLYERYRQLHAGADPKSSLIKTLACNTAEDLGNKGPDYTFGFGLLNARRAVEAMEANRYFVSTLTTGANKQHSITVAPNTRRLKIMLYWADTAAATNAATALVNDLDLTVTEPTAIQHRPLILNAVAANVNDVAVEGIDHLNNIEQVVIDNPPAGNYTININGYAVPYAAQEYVVSYETDQPSVTVEYPFGGEKIVPGETENIRWSAYGNESNNFTIEYSVDNGSNWILIDNNVGAASRKYAWAVPAGIVSNLALIRVTRNGTSLTDQSDYTFTISGSPVVTATNVCEGAVQLDWLAVAGATSYDILKLVADSMQVIGNTASLNFLVKGLNKNVTAWFGVAAKNGAVPGRRSISVSVVPNAGPCALATFNNDIKVDSILEPTTARQGFANAGNAIKPVKISIRNLGSTPVSGPFNVAYNYNNTTITETVNTTIAAGAIYVYTFTGSYIIVPAGFRYDFKAWASLAADASHLNDTAYKTVKYINNDAITAMPVTEGFEAMPAAEYILPEMAIGENSHADFSASTARGRSRSFVNTGFALNGNRAITLDQSPYSATSNTDSLTLNYNLANYAAKQLRLDFYYRNHGNLDAPGNKVWIRGSENNAWIQAWDLFANGPLTGQWKQAIININEVLGNAVPAQTVSQTFQVIIGQQGNTSANTPNAITDIDDGYTIDDVKINEVFNDVAVAKIISPDNRGCSLGAANPIGIQVKNYHSAALNNLAVSYQVNGGVIITENIASIGAGQTMSYVFTQTADFSAYMDYNINVWVNYAADTYAANDSILNFSVHNSPIISTYPYLQNFETGNGFFYAKGTNTSWQWGTPVKAAISKTASGSKAWVTSLTGNYNDNETSYLYSPCFDVSSLAQPVLSFSHILITELGYDYSWVEYSTDGLVWQKLGTAGSGTNWYDNAALINWNATNAKWHVASIDLPLSMATVRFRFVLSSDAGVTKEGIGIDDIHMFDKAAIYTGLPVTGITQNVNSNGWVHFSSGGKRLVSINSNGANLGATTIQAHPFTGTVRNSNNQYYANRNIVVRTANAPTGNVAVRFYFTDAEAKNLIAATGCSTCAKPGDPYELGITKYSGKVTDENGILDDDSTGAFQYILPAATTIVPYDNGYYAEFRVNSFSEFWLSTGSIKPAANGICPGENILFTATAGGTIYQWQQDNGTGYTNITDGALYAGTATANLQLINLPTSFTGYKYRCVKDGVNGADNAVRFTNVWNGNTSTNWFTATNWSCTIVPGQYTDVVIPGGLVNYPFINAGTIIKSISVHPGAIVTVGAGAGLQLNGK